MGLLDTSQNPVTSRTHTNAQDSTPSHLEDEFTAQAKQSRSKLLSLPAELRLQIFANFSSKPDQKRHITFSTQNQSVVSVSGKHFDYRALAPVMRTCKLLHAELEDIIYSNVTFTVLCQNHYEDPAGVKGPSLLHRELHFLPLLRHVNLRVGINGSWPVDSTLEFLCQVMEMLGRDGKVKDFCFELYFWNWAEPVDGHGEAYGEGEVWKRECVLGAKTGSFKTRKIEVAKRKVERLKSLNIA